MPVLTGKRDGVVSGAYADCFNKAIMYISSSASCNPMNKPLGPYEFSRTELQAFSELAQSPTSISQLAKQIRKSQPTVTEIVERLREKGLVTVERLGMRKLVRVGQAKHAQLLREIIIAYPHVPWQSLLAFSQIYPLLRFEGAAPATVSRTTDWRALRNLMAHGIIINEEKGVTINPKFRKLAEFIQEFLTFVNIKSATRLSENAVIVWASGSQFIVRVAAGTRVLDKRFQPTATTALPRYGIRLISDVRYYFFSPRDGALRAEDVALHTLLIDGLTNITYALVLLAKIKVDRNYLLNRGKMVGLYEQIEAMLRFLDTHRPQSSAALPTWDEFVEKAQEYGVDI